MEEVRCEPERFGLGLEPALVWTLPDVAATERLGHALGAWLEPGDFLGLIGTLGAGKTSLTRGLASGFQVEGAVSSPTYALVNLHHGKKRRRLVHIDLYRLERFDDLEGIGYWDYVEDPEALVCVEWLNRIPEAWPGERGALLWLEPVPVQRRRATLYLSEPLQRRSRAALLSAAPPPD